MHAKIVQDSDPELRTSKKMAAKFDESLRNEDLTILSGDPGFDHRVHVATSPIAVGDTNNATMIETFRGANTVNENLSPRQEFTGN